MRGPDNVAADPHPAVEARDHCPIGGRGDAKRVEPCALNPLGRGQRGHDPAVDHRTHGRADEATDGRAGEAEDRAAKGPANGSADSA